MFSWPVGSRSIVNVVYVAAWCRKTSIGGRQACKTLRKTVEFYGFSGKMLTRITLRYYWSRYRACGDSAA